MSFVLIFEKKFWKIFCHFYTKIPPKTAKNGLKWPKNRFVLILEKNFSKNFWKFFIIFIPKPYLKRPKMALNGLKSALFWFLKKNFRKFFLKFFIIFIPKPYPKQLKMGLNDLISPFWPNSSTFEKLDFSLIWPYMASNQAETA